MHRIVYLLFIYTLSLQSSTVENISTKAHIANINTLLIFTSQDSLSSGKYHFTNIGIDMEVYNLPFTYHLDSDDKFNYFILGNVGYSKVNLSKGINIIPQGRLNYENHIRTYTAGLGAGLRYKLSDELHISGGLEFIYSRSGASVKKPDDGIGDAIEDFFNDNYNDNISYKFFVLGEYAPYLSKYYNPYINLSYKLYETKSSFSFDELSTFESQSSVTNFKIGAESSELYTFNTNYLTLEAYLNANYLSGSVSQTIELNHYASVGAVSYLYTPNSISWIKRYFLEVNSIRAEGLEGYNIGVGFTIDY